MLGNKVSPASLYTDSSNPNDVISGGEESQHSQVSLFGCSDAPSSVELFSQSASGSQQGQATTFSQSNDHRQSSNHHICQSQVSNGQKYYMRYLSSVSVSRLATGTNKTPLCADDDKVGTTAHSNASYDIWKCRQQERLERQRIVDDVVKATRDIIARELTERMETLREEMRSVMTAEDHDRQSKVNQAALLSDEQSRSMFGQLLQGQMEMKQQLSELQQHISLAKKNIELVKNHCLLLENKVKQTDTPSLDKHIKTCLSDTIHPLEEALVEIKNRMTMSAGSNGSTASFTKVASVLPKTGQDVGAVPEQVIVDQAVPESKDHHQESDIITSEAKEQTIPSNHEHCEMGPTSTTQEIALLRPLQTGNTSLGSSSTQCDIDLTQQSPSMCSQVISHHLERTGTLETKIKLEHNEKKMGEDITNKGIHHTSKQVTQRSSRSRTHSKSTGVTRSSGRKSRRVLQQHNGVISDEDRDGSELKTVEMKSNKIRRKVTSRTSGKTTGSEVPDCVIASPTNALDDSFYSQAPIDCGDTQSTTLPQPTSSSLCLQSMRENVDSGHSKYGGMVHSQPTTACVMATSNTHSTTSADKFQRSSEAARRRKRIFAELSGSDSVLREISESIRQQKMCKTDPSP